VCEVAPVLERDPEPAGATNDYPFGVERVLVADDPQGLARGNGQRATPPPVILAAAAGDQQRAQGRRDGEQAHGDGILCAAVSRRTANLCAVGAAMLAGCGGEIEVPEDQTAARQGAVLFNERCSGCHSLDAANAYGSKAAGQIEGGERTNGPNFNSRQVSEDDALFAIRNGGFSGAIMPANIVVGRDAELVAEFLARYSGGKGP
jgi:mono/diheme cytochrome c family protein